MSRLALFVTILSIAVPGCAQIFGLDEASPAGTLEVTRISVGAKLVTAPEDLTGLTAEYLVPSDDPVGFTRVPAELVGGAWVAALDEPAPLLFQLPDVSQYLLHDFPHLQRKALHGPMEHPNPEPAPAGAKITVDIALDEVYSGETIQMVAVGAWNNLNLPGITVDMSKMAKVTFDYTTTSSLTGRPHERITADDGVVFVRYAPMSNPQQAVAALEATPFEQTGNDTITGALTKFALEPVEFRVDPAAAVQRYAAVKPAPPAPLAPTLKWDIRAAPGGELGNKNGPMMIAGAIAMTDTTITAMAGNPFAARGWESVLSVETTLPRKFTIPGGGEVALSSLMLDRVHPALGVEMLLAAGLPTEITLGGLALTMDGMTIPKPSAAVEVSFVADVEANTVYQAQLFKIIATTGDRSTLVLDAAALVPRFKFPPEFFEAGAYYTLRAVAIKGGFPGLDDGDLSKRTLPIAISHHDSGVFQVTP